MTRFERERTIKKTPLEKLVFLLLKPQSLIYWTLNPKFDSKKNLKKCFFG
jgi:hypothetical protein